MKKATVYFPHLLNISRKCMKEYIKNPKENRLYATLGEIYFRAAYGIGLSCMFQQMSEAFDIHGNS